MKIIIVDSETVPRITLRNFLDDNGCINAVATAIDIEQAISWLKPRPPPMLPAPRTVLVIIESASLGQRSLELLQKARETYDGEIWVVSRCSPGESLDGFDSVGAKIIPSESLCAKLKEWLDKDALIQSNTKKEP